MSNGCGFNSTGGGQFRQRVDGDYKKNGADNYRLTRTKSRNPAGVRRRESLLLKAQKSCSSRMPLRRI